ncbi:MAG: heme ABC exporter ATP-binding protein CcmA [Burkholderiaceae bacterium]
MDETGPESDSPGSRLVVRDLACRRGEQVLFDGFDLELAPGELIWLRAANGYGKTTLLRVLAGLAAPESGTIEWMPAAKRPILYLAHANALKDDLTVAESVHYLVRLHGLDASDGAMAGAIRRFGLHARRDAPIRFLSQGQRRRVALIRLGLSAPQATWILDEPYDALDSVGVALVNRLLADHVARGGNALLTSHVPLMIDGAPVRTVHLDAM